MQSFIDALIHSNFRHMLRWLAIVAGSSVILSLLLPALNLRHTVLLLVLVLTAVVPFALMPAPIHRKMPAAVPIAAGINMLFLYLSQIWFSSYNSLLIFGLWSMVVVFYFALLCQCKYRQLMRIRWIINALITIALLVAIPDVNGIHMTMISVAKPTRIGIYPIDRYDTRISERSQHFHHVDDNRIDQPVKFKLHSPVAGNAADAVRVLLEPIFPSGFKMLSLSLVNYLGYDARVIERFDNNRIKQVENIGGTPVPLSFDQTSLTIDRLRGHVWLKVPIDTPSDIRLSSPARSNNLIRALLYWQILWLLSIVLAPPGYRNPGRQRA